MKRTALIAAVGAGLLAGSAAAGEGGSAGTLTPVRTGTVHEALFSIALTPKVGFAVGAGGQILMSPDAGKNWKEVVPAPTKQSMFSVTARGGRVIAVGQAGTILTLEPSGKWEPVTSGTDQRLLAVSANRAGMAYAAGAFGTLLKSSDGGKSWASIKPDWSQFTPDGAEPHVYAISVDDAGTVLLGAEFGLVLRSTDAGNSWQVTHKGDASIFALDVRADGVAVAAGQSGTVLRSGDHGQTWEDVASGTTANLLGVELGTGDRAAISGMHELLVSSDTGRTWQRAGGAGVASTWYQQVASDRAGGPMLMVGRAGQVVRLEF